MKIHFKINVSPVLPEKLKRLPELANNFWFSWNPIAISIFKKLDYRLWKQTNHNPVLLLTQISQRKLENAAQDAGFMKLYKDALDDFDAYLSEPETWYKNNIDDELNPIAYFSAEFGVHESMPIFAGGLGVLAGDHCKSASDLNIPFVAVGLLYKEGYFVQQIDTTGYQIENYETNDVYNMPLTKVCDSNNQQIKISVRIAQRIVYAQIWQVNIGRIKLYLLDTDIPDNNDADRQITAQLYGGDKENRICQEILLGIGGVKMLQKLGITPSVWHINEGHSAFLGLERLRHYIIEEKLDFDVALEIVRANSIFTTHTPVEAGHDIFTLSLIDKYFSHFWQEIGISREQFIQLGLDTNNGYEQFNLTIFAFNTSRQYNAVSKMHCETSSKLWQKIWPSVPPEENPITYITNGIHIRSWLYREIDHLFTDYMSSNWKIKTMEPKYWNEIEKIPDEQFWRIHQYAKAQMINELQYYLKKQLLRNNELVYKINNIDKLFSTTCLTIGFARRFAAYKRADLIFRDKERLKRILNSDYGDIQLIFAGKAHPADEFGKRIIQKIYQISNEPGFVGKVIFIEGYNLNIARHLIAGVDVWLNNPRAPMEASGTSGQKAAVNGVINFSILDGWWNEGYNGKNGWIIGDSKLYNDYERQDDSDSDTIYSILEKEIIPVFFERNEHNVPEKWVKLMKESIRSVLPIYNTDRMVSEYFTKLYYPAIKLHQKLTVHNYQKANELVLWKNKIKNDWQSVSIKLQSAKKKYDINCGDKIHVSAEVLLTENIKPQDIKVEIYYGILSNDKIISPVIIEMNMLEKLSDNSYLYQGSIEPKDSGNYGFTLRIVPTHPDLLHKNETGLIHWMK